MSHLPVKMPHDVCGVAAVRQSLEAEFTVGHRLDQFTVLILLEAKVLPHGGGAGSMLTPESIQVYL